MSHEHIGPWESNGQHILATQLTLSNRTAHLTFTIMQLCKIFFFFTCFISIVSSLPTAELEKWYEFKPDRGNLVKIVRGSSLENCFDRYPGRDLTNGGIVADCEDISALTTCLNNIGNLPQSLVLAMVNVYTADNRPNCRLSSGISQQLGSLEKRTEAPVATSAKVEHNYVTSYIQYFTDEKITVTSVAAHLTHICFSSCIVLFFIKKLIILYNKLYRFCTHHEFNSEVLFTPRTRETTERQVTVEMPDAPLTRARVSGAVESVPTTTPQGEYFLSTFNSHPLTSVEVKPPV